MAVYKEARLTAGQDLAAEAHWHPQENIERIPSIAGIIFFVQAIVVVFTDMLGEMFDSFTAVLMIMGISCVISALILLTLPGRCMAGRSTECFPCTIIQITSARQLR